MKDGLIQRAAKALALSCAWILLLPGLFPTAIGQADPPNSATLPFTLDHNRMFVDVEFLRPDGTARKARAWVDTGNPFLMLAEPLARELGFDTSEVKGDEHSVEIDAPPPPMRLGGLSLCVEGVGTRISPGASLGRGLPAEANLPSSVLVHECVVFDYPACLLIVARPGVLEPKGVKIPCRVNTKTGLFMVDVSMDGETVPLGVDNGSAGTWISKDVTKKWSDGHPDLPTATGSAGSTNFFGVPFECGGILMRLPEMQIGALRVNDVAVLGVDQGMFVWYSRKSAGAVSGFIGSNVLRKFRIEIDFPNRTTYWLEDDSPLTADLDIVGLTLRPEPDGGFTVAAVVDRDSGPAVEGVRVGDRLLRVGGLDTRLATMGQVVDALRGAPGEKRTLLLERDGERFSVEAEVLRLP